MKYSFNIIGWGMYLPPKIETSKSLSIKLNKSEQWIISRTGVVERRVSVIDVDDMGAIAAKEAIGNKELPDLIINASGVPKQVIPDTSVFIQKRLNLSGIPSFSVHATCLSFIIALNIAGSLLQTGQHKRILIVSSDRGTRGRNINEPESAALLGDASAAIYIEKCANNTSGLISYNMSTYPEGSSLTEVKGGGTNLHPQESNTTIEDNLFSMNGPLVYKMARKKVYNMIKDDLENNELSINDIDLLVPHQASQMAVKAYSKYGGFPTTKVVNIISKTGNCVAASLPLAFVTAFKENRFKDNEIIYFVGTGAGLSIASAIIKV